jgi:hypothetical protein
MTNAARPLLAGCTAAAIGRDQFAVMRKNSEAARLDSRG